MADDFLIELRDQVRQFARDRDWEQFHSPGNLAAALTVEASELLEQFLWNQGAAASELDPEQRQRVANELADVLIYLVRLADVLDIDIKASALHKIAENGAKYPISLSRGRATKYTELGE